MIFTAHGALLLTLTACLAGAALACYGAWNGRSDRIDILEKLQFCSFGFIAIAFVILLYALLTRDFSLSYVARYTDNSLPLFYTIAAVWAGQEGSLLFWATLVACFGCITIKSPTYKKLSSRHKLYFWLFYMFTQAFFLLLLTKMSNPFVAQGMVLSDGQGLNPLLRNIGMVLHPPLLFLGYAGFTVPVCLALGAVAAGDCKAWHAPAHNWIIASWATLTAGILLGGWWAYMELGWGGYWAWDPVENASLIPWFTATGLIHARMVERRFGYLSRTTIFLACITFVLCIFATYLVRSGVVQSLHAFGQGAVGAPLLFGIIIFSLLSVVAIVCMPRSGPEDLPSLASRTGIIIMLIWLLVVLGLVVVLGTIWPVFSQLWETKPMVVSQGFYNVVCLPLFVIMAVLLAVAPWLGWNGGVWNPYFAAATVLAWAAAIAIGVATIEGPVLSIVGMASATSMIITIISLMIVKGRAAWSPSFFSAQGTHLAFALIVLGVAVSGPFQQNWERPLAQNESFSASGYTFTYTGLRNFSNKMMTVAEAAIDVKKDGKPVGTLYPQQRMYKNFNHPNSEVSTLFSLGTEVYATIHDIDNGLLQPLRISIHPLINWIWIGSILICIFPLLALRRRKIAEEASHVR